MRRLDPAVEAAIREALADPGASYASVAEKVGCHKATVRKYALRWCVARDTHHLTTEQQEKIVRMLRAGTWTYRQIAKGVGCSMEHVQITARKLGINRIDRRHQRLERT
jgi:DNA invertase Pin-like site-specific DNA recombinase